MSAFSQQFSRLRRLQWAGRLTAALLAAAAATVAVWVLLGAADALLALSVRARLVLTGLAGAAAGLLALTLLVRAAAFSAPRAAASLDALTGSARRPVSAALGLPDDPAATPLARWLAGRAREEAAAALGPVPAFRALPRRALAWAVAAVLAAGAVTGGLWMADREAFSTVAQRLLHPGTDLPPWSRLRFALEPASPSALYGGEALLTVTCSESPDQPVECLVRTPRTGEVLRLPAARESGQRFSRRLESLTEPVEVAFAAGRARSGWTPLEIRYQPRILSGTLVVEPPAWMGQPALTLPLDAPEVTVPEGARLTLRLTSNRPLGGGTLTLTPGGKSAAPPPREAALTTQGAAEFAWTATVSGTLAVTLRDVRGTPSDAPLTLPLTVRPDQPPSVELTSPPPLLLATPRTVVPLSGGAEDDHGLSRMRLVRTLAGFRDRPVTVAPALRERRYDYAGSLDLAPLGLVPGQTIEVFLEAADHNPSMLGQASSAVSRVKIISEDEYGERIRAQTVLKEFGNRFNAAQAALKEAREALTKLEEALAAGDPAAVEEAREAAEEAHRKAAGLMEKLADDFPAFAMEQRLKDLARAAAAPLRENLSGLGSLPADAAAAQAAVAEMKRRLEPAGSGLDQLQGDAAKVAQMGTLLEMAAKFREIYQTQESLVRRVGTIVEEMRKGTDQNRRLLPSLADTQEKNREALDAFVLELRLRAGALPLDDAMLTPMRISALDFADAVETAQPGSAMDAATEAGRRAEILAMLQNAELARSILERLMQKQDPFPQACQGQCASFTVPHPDMNETMAQLLQGMCNKPGSRPGTGTSTGGGMGMGQAGPTGAAQPGYGQLDLPVMGPSRLQFDAPSMGGGGGGKDGRTPGREALPVTAEQATLKPGDLRSGDTPPPSSDPVPEAYRDAVKRYFTPSGSDSSPQQPVETTTP